MTSPAPPPSVVPPVAPSIAPSVGPTATPVVTADVDPAAIDALQDVLAGEHAVVWAYGALGPRLDEVGTERAYALLALHERSREALRAQLLGAGAQPVAAEPAYTLPVVPVDPPSAAALARLVEERLAAVYADLVAASADQVLRTQGVGGVVDSTLRAASWGPTPTAFPGLPERAAG